LGRIYFNKKRIKGAGQIYNGADILFYLPVFLPVINMRIRLSELKYL